MYLIFHLSQVVRGVFLFILVGLTILMLAIRIVLPDIEEYREQIVSQISQAIGAPVEIGKIRAVLNGFQIQAEMTDVAILHKDSGEVLLRFAEMRGGLNTRKLLVSGEFQPQALTVIGAQISIRREVDGELKLVGFDSGGEMPQWFVEDGRFQLLDSEVTWRDLTKAGVEVTLSHVDVRVSNHNHRHRMAIDLALPNEYGHLLSIRVDFRGNPFLPDCCDGQIYFEANDLEYGALLEDLTVYGYGIHSGHGNIRLWSTLEKSALNALSGEVEIDKPHLFRSQAANGEADLSFSPNHLSTFFNWVKDDKQWNFSLNRLFLEDAKVVDGFRFAQTRNSTDGRTGYSGVASYVNLQQINNIGLGLQIVGSDTQQLLETLAPRGELHKFRVNYDESSEALREFQVCGEFLGVGINSWRNYLGVKNLTGRICGNENKGWVKLGGTNTEFSLPEVFRYPILLDTLQGVLHWNTSAQGRELSSEMIVANTADISTRSRLTLNWTKDSLGPVIDLLVKFDKGNGSKVYRYLPYNVLSKPTIDWLDRAFLSGVISKGGMILRGPVEAFPYRGSEGVFEVLFNTRDVELIYHQDWPHAFIENGDVRFFQAGMEIHVNRSSILGAAIDTVNVVTSDFDFDDYMNIKGAAHGSIPKMLEVLKRSPLGSDYESLLNVVTLSGENNLNLKLKIPVSDRVSEVLVEGVIDLKKAKASTFSVNFEQIKGRLNFTHSGLNGSGISARIFGAPVTLELSDIESGMALKISGEMGVGQLRKHYASDLWEHFGGRSNYRIDLNIPKLSEKLFADISLMSNLKGIEVKLPAPLAKSARQIRPLRLKMHLEKDRDIPLNIEYDRVFKSHLIYSGDEKNLNLKRGVVQLGGTTIADDPSTGLGIYAHAESIDLDPWHRFFKSFSTKSATSSGLLSRVEINTSHLKYSNQDFGALEFSMRKQGKKWLGFSKNQYIDGYISTFGGGEKNSGIEMDLNVLKLPQFKDKEGVTVEKTTQWEPQAIPPLRIKAADFILKKIHFGRLELLTSKQSKGIKINRLTVADTNHRLNLSGDWLQLGRRIASSVSGDLKIDDLGLFLSHMGKADVIEKSATQTKFNLNWKGAPFQLQADSLSGSADIEFGQGRLLTVEPGIGHLFGLFNLDALKSLLLLDFGHLFGVGLAFDELKSSFQLLDGRATIRQFYINAVPANITVEGDIDLVDEKLDDIVTVIPKGVVAMGASVLLNQQLPGHAVDGLISRQYGVTGKWDSPAITRLPGSGGLLRNGWLPDFNPAE